MREHWYYLQDLSIAAKPRAGPSGLSWRTKRESGETCWIRPNNSSKFGNSISSPWSLVGKVCCLADVASGKRAVLNAEAEFVATARKRRAERENFIVSDVCGLVDYVGLSENNSRKSICE